MATPLLHLVIFFLLLPTALSATCSAPKLTSATNCTTCIQLPSLTSALRYTYTPANKTLSVAFTAFPPSSSGWVAVGINPNATGMAGTQAFVAYKNTSHGGVTVATFNLSSHSDVIPGELSFPVYTKRAEFNAADGSITVYATVKSDGGKVNFVWQVGPGVTNGFPEKHDFEKENLPSKVTVNVSSASGGVLLKKTKLSGTSSPPHSLGDLPPPPPPAVALLASPTWWRAWAIGLVCGLFLGLCVYVVHYLYTHRPRRRTDSGQSGPQCSTHCGL